MSVVAATINSTGSVEVAGADAREVLPAQLQTIANGNVRIRDLIVIRRSYSATNGPGSGLWLTPSDAIGTLERASRLYMIVTQGRCSAPARPATFLIVMTAPPAVQCR